MTFALLFDDFISETFDEFYSAGLNPDYLPRGLMTRGLLRSKKRTDIAVRALKMARMEIERK
uniref:Uncharacterized protein n=1 Tax=Archaeoglobus fulgidus TaxID=2234 RepID=A0A7J2TL91_ARCFL